jgi:hypothetical protein
MEVEAEPAPVAIAAVKTGTGEVASCAQISWDTARAGAGDGVAPWEGSVGAASERRRWLLREFWIEKGMGRKGMDLGKLGTGEGVTGISSMRDFCFGPGSVWLDRIDANGAI